MDAQWIIGFLKGENLPIIFLLILIPSIFIAHFRNQQYTKSISIIYLANAIPTLIGKISTPLSPEISHSMELIILAMVLFYFSTRENLQDKCRLVSVFLVSKAIFKL